MEKIIIKTMANGQMFINGVDVGTSRSTQYGMTGDPVYVIAKFVRQILRMRRS